MNKPFLALLLLVLGSAVSACQQYPGGRDVLHHLAPPGWGVPGEDYVVGSKGEIPGRYQIIEWIRYGDDINDWSELVTNENWSLTFAKATLGTPREYVDNKRKFQESFCPGRSGWNIIKSDETDIVYEVWFKPCPDLAKHYKEKGAEAIAWVAEIEYYEIARIMDGTWDRFRVAYAVRGPELSAEERSEWLTWLESARVRPAF